MNFHFINQPHAAFPFSWMQGKGQPTVDPKSGWQQGVYDLGPFKLDQLQSKKPIFAKCFSTLLMSHMQHFPFSVSRKRAPYNGPQKWMTKRGVWPLAIQIRSFAVHETYFCQMDFHFINKPHAAFPFSCIQRKRAPHSGPKSEWHQGVSEPWAFKLEHL